MSRYFRSAIAKSALLLLGGCVTAPAAAPTVPAPSATCPEPSAAPAPAPAPAAPTAPPAVDLDALYREAIFRSAVVTPGDKRTLKPLEPDAKGTFTVTTWAGCRGAGGPGKCGSYEAGKTVSVKWDIWVTGGNEVQDRCKTFKGELVLKISQLLGLPAPASPLSPDTTERQFVTFSGVPAASIFRPCTDSRVDTDFCETKLPEKQPANAPAGYYEWFTRQAMSSWQVPEKGQPPTGFPWTRLGYTYNWAPGEDRYGASEYVISGASKEVKLTVSAVSTAKDFCQP